MITRMDSDIGRLFALLKKLGIDDETLVIFTSDNGPHREGGNDPDFNDSNGQLRGMKRDLYEGGIRVPMIARWPAKIRPNSVSHHVSAFWDFMPTCAEIAKVKTPENIDGISYPPTLLGHPEQQKQHEYLYWELSKRQAVRMGNWKAVRLNLQKNPDAPIELYNLAEDIAKQHNIADQHPEIVAEMWKIMKKAHTPSPSFSFI